MNFNLGKIGLCLLLALSGPDLSLAQSPIKLSDFVAPSKSWKEVDQVWADPTGDQLLYTEGSGSIMVNLPDKKNPGKDIISSQTYGDLALKMVYMMAPGSNSGLYLQGQYEIQLFDSWTKVSPKAGDNAGIYERWDDSRPEGQKGYDGHAPRQNASKAPGLWQTLELGFQAPKFSDSGEKIQNARIRYLRLNGVTVQENVELLGPTRGALKNTEVARGPIRIQGDHGPIAIQSLEISPMDTAEPKLSNLTQEVYSGAISDLGSLENQTPVGTSALKSLNEFSSGITGSSFSKITGSLIIANDGNYRFEMEVPQGMGGLSIGAEPPTALKQGSIELEKTLSAGTYPVTFLVSKPRDWSSQGFSLEIQEKGLWPITLSQPAGMTRSEADPIWVDAAETPVLRSFIELQDRSKISHAVSVSSQAGIHFSYDLSTGRLIRVWRGMFLNATPMWNDRGNGVSVPLGNLTYLTSKNQEESIYTSENFMPSGYKILGDGNIQFLGKNPQAEIKDHIQLLPDGKGLKRSLQKTSSNPLEVAVAEGQSLKMVRENLYWMEEAGLFLLMENDSVQPKLNSNGQIVLPFQSELIYTLLF